MPNPCWAHRRQLVWDDVLFAFICLECQAARTSIRVASAPSSDLRENK